MFGPNRDPQQRAFVAADGPWTWAELSAAAVALSQQMREAAWVCNLCQTRLGYWLTFLACLAAGKTQVFPPSGGTADLAALAPDGEVLWLAYDSATEQTLPRQLGLRPWLVQPQRPASAPDRIAPVFSDLFGARAEAIGLILFTSGSTGIAQPQRKRLSQLLAGAQVLQTHLNARWPGVLGQPTMLVSSVPLQHMFGLEAGVMLPLVAGLPVLEAQPLLPSDVEQVFANAPSQRLLWIATPMHLAALARAEVAVQHCAGVIASTMPLSAAVAAHTETLIGAPVLEIYGATETGAIAMRRTAQAQEWAWMDGVQILPSDGAPGLNISGRHFQSPCHLLDEIELLPQGNEVYQRFRLLGRQADMVKIGGRRTSLAHLNLVLAEMPGWVDGALTVSSAQGPANATQDRLALVYTGALDINQARSWLRARVDPLFIPRYWFEVKKVPRTPGGKLDRPALEHLVRERLEKQRR